MSAWRRVAKPSERLNEAMKLTGKKQADIVRETGLNRGTISRYLSGAYEPKQAAITRLAAALDVSGMWLWGYDVPMERREREKKNDDLVEIITLLRSDSEFYEIVCTLSKLSNEQRESIKKLLAAFMQQ